MEIKVLGTGCAKCKKVEQICKEIVAEMNVGATVTKVENIADIMAYGVMRTPAVVINEKVMLSGRIPAKDEVREWLKD